MWVILGLGNPGLRYKWSRHNIGFQVIDLVAKFYHINLSKDRFAQAITGKGMIGESKVLLVKPTTYMNRSGLALKRIQDLHNIPSENILVIIDDIDLPWKKMRIRKKGTSGGHKGLQSIITEIGSNNFPRLRMGIGKDLNSKIEISDYVLGKFNKKEKTELEDFCNVAVSALQTIISENIEAAMNKFNSSSA